MLFTRCCCREIQGQSRLIFRETSPVPKGAPCPTDLAQVLPQVTRMLHKALLSLLAGDESELLSQGTSWKSHVNPQHPPTPPSGGKPDGSQNRRTIPGEANGVWLWLFCPRMELPLVNLLLEQIKSHLGVDQCMHIAPAWHGTSTSLSHCTGDQQGFTYPGETFQDNNAKLEDLQNNSSQ